jgi:hypothetical protein
MRRGFRAQAETISLEQRAEMELGERDRLDPFELARFLGIPVVSFDDCGDAMGLGRRERIALSALRDRVFALTACAGTRKVIIYNDRNPKTRQVSDIAHEVSHTLLEHEPTPINDPDRYRDHDPELEDQANYLAGALLMPREGALSLMRSGMTCQEVAEHYGVSPQMARWRTTATGVTLQLERARRLRHRN